MPISVVNTPIIDGAGNPKQVRAGQNSADGSIAFHQIIEANGVEVTTAAPLPITGSIGDGLVTTRRATVSAFHSADNQSPGGTAFGLLTGGVAQILNGASGLDRQRGTGFDNIPATGIATGTQQLAGTPLITSITSGAITGSAIAQSVTLGSVSFSNRGVTSTIQVGTALLVEPGLSTQEIVMISSISSSTITAVFLNNHLSGSAVRAFTYNQARDATIPDGSTPAGIAASATYLYNALTESVEFERSFAGELMGATGTGTAIASEYTDSSGGPPLVTGFPSGLRLMPAQSLHGIGSSGPVTITTTAANDTTIVFGSSAATKSLPAGHAIILTGSGTTEVVFSAQSFVSGNSVGLQSPVVNSGQTTARWSVFAPNGPGLTGFGATGLSVAEETVYDPVTDLFYLERAATADAAAPQNVVMESTALWNGTTMDRARSATVGNNVAATGLAAGALYGQFNTTLPSVSNGNYSAAQMDSAGRLIVTSQQGALSLLNISVATVVKGSPGRIVRVSVVTAGSGAGTVNDCTTTGAVAAANTIATIPTAVGVIVLEWPCAVGIVVAPGSSQVLAVSYS